MYFTFPFSHCKVLRPTLCTKVLPLSLRRCKHTKCTAFAWGNNLEGQLGVCLTPPPVDPYARRRKADDAILPQFEPKPISIQTEALFPETKLAQNREGLKITRVWAGEETSFFAGSVDGEAVLLTTKKTTTDEEQSPIQLVEEAPNPIQIGFGRFHTLLCNEKGEQYALGRGYEGQLGIGENVAKMFSRISRSATPSTSDTSSSLSSVSPVHSLAASGSHSACISEDGKLWTWGSSNFYELGHESSLNEHFPKHVTLLPSDITHASCGFYHTVAVSGAKDVYCWGRNLESQCGITGSKVVTKPTLMFSLNDDERCISLCSGHYHNLLLTDKHRIFVWGMGKHGELGLGDEANPQKAIAVVSPTAIPGESFETAFPPVKISTSSHHNLCVTEDNQLWVWGNGTDYQLGMGDRTCLYSPTKLPLTDDSTKWSTLDISAGRYHSLALAVPK